MTELLNCTGLSKAYGKKRALDHVDLHLEPGKDLSLFQEDGLVQHRLNVPDQVSGDDHGGVLAVVGENGVQDVIPRRRVHTANGFVQQI